MAKSAVEASDPVKSPWWLILSIGGAAIGVSAQEMGAIVGAVVGGVVGAAVSAVPPVKTWLSDRAADDRVAELAGVGETIPPGRDEKGADPL